MVAAWIDEITRLVGCGGVSLSLPIGEHLRAAGLLTTDEVADVLDVQRLEGGRFCSVALRRGLCSERALVRALSRQLMVPGVCLSDVSVDELARRLVPVEVKERLGVLPDRMYARSVTILMRDPHDGAAVDELRLYTKRIVRPAVVLEGPLMALIRGNLAVPTPPGLAPPGPSRAGRSSSAVGAVPLSRPIPLPRAAPGGGALDVERAHPKIVIIGDDGGVCAAVARRLGEEGYGVVAPPETAPLIDLLHRHRPAAVIIGDVLPAARSFNLCQRIKAHAELRQIRVVLLTGRFTGWRARADLMNAFGVDEVISELADVPLATETISRLIGGLLPGGPPQRALQAAARHAFEDGLVSLRGDRTAVAQQAFEQSVAADPFAARPHYYLGRLHDEAGRTFDAIAAYEEAVRLDPDNLRALKALALTYQRAGFTHLAAGTWERALSVCRDATTRRAIRGHLLRLLR